MVCKLTRHISLKASGNCTSLMIFPLLLILTNMKGKMVVHIHTSHAEISSARNFLNLYLLPCRYYSNLPRWQLRSFWPEFHNNHHKMRALFFFFTNYSCGTNQLCSGEACRHEWPKWRNDNGEWLQEAGQPLERQPDLEGSDGDAAALHNPSHQVWIYFQTVLKSRAQTFGVWTCDGEEGVMFRTTGAAEDRPAGQLYLIR